MPKVELICEKLCSWLKRRSYSGGLLDEFIQALEGKGPLDASGRDHVKSLALVFACIEAAKTGARIDLGQFHRQAGIPESWSY